MRCSIASKRLLGEIWSDGQGVNPDFESRTCMHRHFPPACCHHGPHSLCVPSLQGAALTEAWVYLQLPFPITSQKKLWLHDNNNIKTNHFRSSCCALSLLPQTSHCVHVWLSSKFTAKVLNAVLLVKRAGTVCVSTLEWPPGHKQGWESIIHTLFYILTVVFFNSHDTFGRALFLLNE